MVALAETYLHRLAIATSHKRVNGQLLEQPIYNRIVLIWTDDQVGLVASGQAIVEIRQGKG